MGIVSPAPAILLIACNWALGLVSWLLRGVKVKDDLGVTPTGTGLTALVETTVVAEKQKLRF